MKYFQLLIIFPPEIVAIIAQYILISDSADTIYHHLSYYTKKNKILYNSIEYIINHDNYGHTLATYFTPYSFIKKISVSSLKNIENLEFISNTYYSQKLKFNYFWSRYLTALSYKIMDQYNKIHMFNLDNNNTKCYKNLKITIQLWFKLCKKFNLKLALYTRIFAYNISNNDYKITYEYARNIKPIKNFNKFVCPPVIVNPNNFPFSNNVSLEFLRSINYSRLL